MIEEKTSIENKSALELSKKMLNYNICKTNGQFFIWVLSEYWIPDLQRACLTPGKAINTLFTRKHSWLKVSASWKELQKNQYNKINFKV